MPKASGLRRFDLIAERANDSPVHLGYDVSTSDVMMLIRAAKDPDIRAFRLIVKVKGGPFHVNR